MNYVIVLNIKGSKLFDKFIKMLRNFIKTFKGVEINSTYTEKEWEDSLDNLL